MLLFVCRGITIKDKSRDNYNTSISAVVKCKEELITRSIRCHQQYNWRFRLNWRSYIQRVLHSSLFDQEYFLFYAPRPSGLVSILTITSGRKKTKKLVTSWNLQEGISRCQLNYLVYYVLLVLNSNRPVQMGKKVS